MTSPTESTTPLPPTPAAQEPPPIWFLAPEGFFALPLAATPEERAERSQSFVRELYSRGDENIWEPAAPYYAAIAELMAGTGVSYSAMGLFSTAEEGGEEESGETIRHEGSAGVAQCAFTLAAVPTDQAGDDTDVVAQGIMAILSGDEYNDARWLDLPCGPAVSCVTLREYKIRPELTESGEQVDLLTGQVQVHVPFPTGPFTAVFTLYTASMDYWTEFCDMMAAVLQTVSFTDPA
ncbi:hypothetical protein QF035_006107 [Streptomyces umbrinus]|uniref:Uncharacterized protein n=1 Tax=Streptomyces umbrinus TaxID=67370 RepID=A0ABU0SY91_9ACTN|nr:hypothetical protein [Streptomyces umbrinus]MDQ1028525.1 hypothetical protein [Streptomyces umbrinus]